jgi:hypothetical protein
MVLLLGSTNNLQQEDLLLNVDETNSMKYNANNSHINLLTAHGDTTTREAGTSKFLSLQIHDNLDCKTNIVPDTKLYSESFASRTATSP